ncbi:hypothetical protein A3E47_00095 [Candidatus Peribacteria bacterium RIFCSPHIGHO2_12_FULL_54_10]|nr:MAG: hypothetical protein A3E47_00095 [Candidatus Peribacteria bacterium RIFCSPHIGHO2_12_FULL_54_10]
MHIVLLNDDALPTARGGAAVVVDHLRRAYAQAGHTVTLITTQQQHERWEEESDGAGRIIRLPIRTSLRNRHRLCTGNPAAASHVKNALRELRPDAVHAHNLHAYLSYESLLLAKEHTDRTILTAHDTFLVSFGRIRENRRLTLLDHLATAGRNYSPFRNRRIRGILQKSKTRVIAISNTLASFLRQNGIQIHAVVYNGTAISATPERTAIENFRKTHGLQGPTILFGGRIGADKGIGVLQKAFAVVRSEIPSAQLAIAGNRERIEHSVRDTQGIVLLGHLQQPEMLLAYAAASLVTTPSIYLDPFNLMNIEAMAAGKAVVGTTFGGTPEIVVDGETGFLVDPHNTERFARALLTLLHDPQRAHRMGEQGKKRVSEDFSLEKQAKTYLALLDRE